MTVTQEDGTEIEVFTQEDLDARTQEESERIASEKQVEIERLASEGKERDEELEKLRNKDMNFERVRKAGEKKSGELPPEAISQIEELKKRMDEITAQPKIEVKDQFIRNHIGDDKEKKDMFEYYFGRLVPENATKDQVTKAAEEAMTLLSKGEYKPDTSSAMFSASASANYRNSAPKETSEISKQMGAMFGVTEEDRKKYGDK